jgi:dCTP diphosphatase
MSLKGSLSGRWRHCRGGSEPRRSPILIRVADLEDLTALMRAFTEARDWGRFHDVKSLTLALTGEIGEVAELVQWLPADTVVDGELQARLGDELADVLLYLVRLADVAGVDLGAAALTKLARNEGRFPAATFHGVPPQPI